MIDFKEITLEDKQWVKPLLEGSNYRSQEYSFTFMFLWKDVFAYTIGRVNDYFVLKSQRPDHPVSYLFPAGRGDVRPVLEALDRDASTHGVPLIFHAVLHEGREMLDVVMQNEFEFIELVDYYDYVYETHRMQNLNGKKLASKRNHINRFHENYPDWTYETITPDNLGEVAEMNEKWLEAEGAEDTSKSFGQEASSVDGAIAHFQELGLHGGLLRCHGEVVAFTMGDAVSSDTVLIHIEKAFKEIQGAYPMINQQFALTLEENITFINREDDSGHPGLRRAKRSYQPIFMVEKYGAKHICKVAEGGRGNGQPCYE